PFDAPVRRQGAFSGGRGRGQETMFALAAAVRVVTGNADDAFPHADPVGAMRIIGFAFRAQHGTHSPFLTGRAPKLPPTFARRFFANLFSPSQMDAFDDMFRIA